MISPIRSGTDHLESSTAPSSTSRTSKCRTPKLSACFRVPINHSFMCRNQPNIVPESWAHRMSTQSNPESFLRLRLDHQPLHPPRCQQQVNQVQRTLQNHHQDDEIIWEGAVCARLSTFEGLRRLQDGWIRLPTRPNQATQWWWKVVEYADSATQSPDADCQWAMSLCYQKFRRPLLIQYIL